MARTAGNLDRYDWKTLRAKLLSFAVISLFSMVSAHAEAEVAPTPPPVTSEGPLLVRPGAKKGKRREQKETEGTEAPGRFEADTILKSTYHVDGQPLEVDPD